MNYTRLLKKILPLILFILFTLLSLQIPIDPDLGINLRVGEYILKFHTFPHTDLFSFSLPYHPYAYYSWLSQLIMAYVYKNQGLMGISLVFTFLCGIGIYSLWRLCKKSLWMLLIFLVISPLIFSSLGVRPLMFSFLFFIFETFLFLYYQRRQKAIILLLFVPLFFLWANMHPGFMMGLGVVVLFLLSEYLTHRRHIFIILSTLLISFLATLASPYGFSIYTQVWTILENRTAQQTLIDWMPLVNRSIIHVIVGFLSFLGLFLYLKLKKKNWPLYCISLVLFLFTIKSTRTVVPFLVFYLPLLSELVATIPSPIIVLKKNRFYSLVIILLLSLSVLSRIMTNGGVFHETTASIQSLSAYRQYPYHALPFIKPHAQNIRLLNYFTWGGFLVWQIPGLKVFETGIMDAFMVDDHYFLDDYFTLVTISPGYEKLLVSYNINALLLPPDLPFVQKLRNNPNWNVYYEDKQSVFMQNTNFLIQ